MNGPRFWAQVTKAQQVLENAVNNGGKFYVDVTGLDNAAAVKKVSAIRHYAHTTGKYIVGNFNRVTTTDGKTYFQAPIRKGSLPQDIEQKLLQKPANSTPSAAANLKSPTRPIKIVDVLEVSPTKQTSRLTQSQYEHLISIVEDGANLMRQGDYVSASKVFSDTRRASQAGFSIVDGLPASKRYFFDKNNLQETFDLLKIQDETKFLDALRDRGYFGNYNRSTTVEFKHIDVLTPENFTSYIPKLKAAGFNESQISQLGQQLSSLSDVHLKNLRLLQQKNAFSGLEEWAHGLQWAGSTDGSEILTGSYNRSYARRS